MSKKHSVLSLSLSASLCLIPNIVLADPFVVLEGVTLVEDTSSGIGEAKIVSNKKLEKIQAKEMKDIFKGEPSVSVGGAARNAQRVYLRGIEGTNLNITVDGAKQGGSLHQHAGDIGGINPALLKSVEVSTIAGADSGSGALGGSIAMETVDAQDLLQKEQNFGFMARGGYTSVSDGFNAGTTLMARINPYSALLLDISGLNQDDYQAGGGKTALNTATDDRNYFFKYSLLDYENHSLKLGATHNKYKGNYRWAGPLGSDGGVPNPDDPTDKISASRDTFTIDHRYNPENDLIDLKTNLYVNKKTLKNRSTDSEISSTNIGGVVKNKMFLETGDLYHILTFGGDYNVEDGESRAKKITSKTLGFFTQGSTAYDMLTLNYGVRFDDYDAKYSATRTFKGNEFSPNIGIDLEIFEGMSLFTSYSESIKIGSIIPIGWLVNTTPKTLYNGSVDGIIKPETSKQIEGGLRYKSKGFFIDNDTFTTGFSLFKTTISNLVERGEGGGGPVLTINNNPLDVISKGFEIRNTWELGGYKTALSFLHIDTEDENGNPIMNSRRKAASIGDTIIWDNTWALNSQWQFGYTLTSVREFDDVSAGAAKRPSYELHDIYVQYEPRSTKNLTFNFGINNLFDKEYYAHTSLEGKDGSLVKEPGRDIRMSFKYTF